MRNYSLPREIWVPHTRKPCDYFDPILGCTTAKALVCTWQHCWAMYMLIVPIKRLRLVPRGISSRQGCPAQRKSPSPLVAPSEMAALSALELVLSVRALSRRTGPPPQSSSNTGPELRKQHRSTAMPRPR